MPAKRVKLGLDWCAFRYDIAEESIGDAQYIHERQMRKLSGMSPGLGRYLSRKLGRTDRGSAMRSGEEQSMNPDDRKLTGPEDPPEPSSEDSSRVALPGVVVALGDLRPGAVVMEQGLAALLKSTILSRPRTIPLLCERTVRPLRLTENHVPTIKNRGLWWLFSEK